MQARQTLLLPPPALSQHGHRDNSNSPDKEQQQQQMFLSVGFAASQNTEEDLLLSYHEALSHLETTSSSASNINERSLLKCSDLLSLQSLEEDEDEGDKRKNGHQMPRLSGTIPSLHTNHYHLNNRSTTALCPDAITGNSAHGSQTDAVDSSDLEGRNAPLTATRALNLKLCYASPHDAALPENNEESQQHFLRVPEVFVTSLAGGESPFGAGSVQRHRTVAPSYEAMLPFTIVDVSELPHVIKRHAAAAAAAQRRQKELCDQSVRTRPVFTYSSETHDEDEEEARQHLRQCHSVAPPLPAFVSRNTGVVGESNESISLLSPEQLESYASMLNGASTATTRKPFVHLSFGSTVTAEDFTRTEDEDSMLHLLAPSSNMLLHNNILPPIAVPISVPLTISLLQGGDALRHLALPTPACSCGGVAGNAKPQQHCKGPQGCRHCRASAVVQEAGGKVAFMEQIKALYCKK
jgi:hypothetical protein